MKLFKQVVSAALALTIGVGAATFTPAENTASAASSAVSLVESMGMGWNLGNAFDCAPVAAYVSKDPYVDSETGWGNPKTTKAMIAAIKNAGFNTVRIPVTWVENMDSSGTVDADYLARIKEVVDYCIDLDMYAIINVHHDGSSEGANASSNAYKGGFDGAWLWQGSSQKTKFNALWKQIATYFKSYDNHLAFAGWNEICWDYEVEYEMGSAFINTVRATGGNNASRLLIIPANNTNLDAALDSSFKLPIDDQEMMAVEIHYYSPPEFSIRPANANWGKEVNTWGTTSEINDMKNDVNNMYQKFAANGIPVIIGECGVLTEENRDKASIRAWIKTLFETSLGYDGICPVLWDTSDAGDIKYFSRKDMKWYDTELENIFKNMTGVATNTTTTYTFSGLNWKFETTTENGYLHYTYPKDTTVDIKQFKGMANIIGVLVNYTAEYDANASNPCFGLTVACNGYLSDEEPYETPSEYVWMNNQSSLDCRESTYTLSFDDAGMSYNKDDVDYGPFTQEGVDWHLSYDFLQFQSWWGSNSGNFTIDSVTVLFDSPIVLDDSGSVVTTPSGETTTTTTTTTTETTTSASVTESTSATAARRVWGDADENGKFEMVDLVRIARSLAGQTALSVEGRANCDVYADNNISDQDLSIALKYMAGSYKEAQLPILP